ncbi:MAG: hypothetical protein KKD21_15365, partial [Proteobacteria bacterium]|nr:hypothetical protein [Pseudomonadota bacterium]
FSSTIGGAIGPFMAGYIFDVTHSYKIVFLILTVLCIIALTLTATLKSVLQDKVVSDDITLNFEKQE